MTELSTSILFYFRFRSLIISKSHGDHKVNGDVHSINYSIFSVKRINKQSASVLWIFLLIRRSSIMDNEKLLEYWSFKQKNNGLLVATSIGTEREHFPDICEEKKIIEIFFFVRWSSSMSILCRLVVLDAFFLCFNHV